MRLAFIGLCLLAFAGCADRSTSPGKPDKESMSSNDTSALAVEQTDGNGAKQSSVGDNVANVLALIEQRLELMHDVAKWKWNNNVAIEDQAREAELLKRLTNDATKIGISAQIARSFFRAQITAAKTIQQSDFEKWRADDQQDFKDVPDLKRELRPKITKLSRELLSAIKTIEPDLGTAKLQEELKQQIAQSKASQRFGKDVWHIAAQPLVNHSD